MDRVLRRFFPIVASAIFVLLLSSCLMNSTEEGQSSVEVGTWLTAPLERESDRLYLNGIDLTTQAKSGRLYTYYQEGTWVALIWEGYQENRTVFRIPDELKVELNSWEDNKEWSVDFWWPDASGAYPSGAHPGTSTR